jgi:hypothetical protein
MPSAIQTRNAMKTIRLQDLYTVCDQSGDVPAPSVIADSLAGYALTLDVRGEQYEVTGKDGERLRFRTIEHLLDVLIDAPDLAPVARLDFSRWLPTPRYC